LRLWLAVTLHGAALAARESGASALRYDEVARRSFRERSVCRSRIRAVKRVRTKRSRGVRSCRCAATAD